MKLIAHPEKTKGLERQRRVAIIHKKEEKKQVIATIPIERVEVAKKPEEEPNREWYIETSTQLLKVEMDKLKGQHLFAEAGTEVYKSNVDTKIKRLFFGDRLIDRLFEPYVAYYNDLGGGEVGFAGDVPGEIAVLKIEPNESIITQKGTFIAGIGDKDKIDISVQIGKIKNIGNVLFGGGGFLLTKLTNHGKKEGTIFVHACGGYNVLFLEENQTVTLDIGAAIAWESTVKFEVKVTSLKRGILGEEGMFVNDLTGPGIVVVQSTTLPKMKERIGETICLGPMPIVMWQLIQRQAKRFFYRILIGR